MTYEQEFEALRPFLKKSILDKGAKWRKDLPEEKKKALEPYLELRRRVFSSKNPLVKSWVEENYSVVGRGPRGQKMRIRRMKKRAGDYISGARVGHEMVVLMKVEEKRLEELLRRKF